MRRLGSFSSFSRAPQRSDLYYIHMALFLADSLAVKQSLGQAHACRLGPSLDPEGWKGSEWMRNQENRGITIDPSGQGKDLDAARGDLAMANADGYLVLAPENEEARKLAEEYEAEMRAIKKEQRQAAATMQKTVRGRQTREHKRLADEFEDDMRAMRGKQGQPEPQ